MPWRAHAAFAGFSEARPWLPPDPNHRDLAVDCQEQDPNSTLILTRRLLALRRRHAALREGDFETLFVDDALLVLRRSRADDVVLAAFNLGDAPRWHELPDTPLSFTGTLSVNGARLEGRRLTLPAHAALILPVNHPETYRHDPGS